MAPRPARRPAPIRERAFHQWLARTLPAGREGLLPLGDDAAAIVPPKGRVAVLTTDSLVEGTHFLPESPPGWVGRAAAGVSLSDAAAKGAEPAALLLSLLVPPGTPQRWAEQVALGADRMGRRFGAPLVGGDTKPAPTRAVVSTVVGWGYPRRLVPRGDARPGDVVVTTGTVGRGGLAAYRWESSSRSVAARRRALRELLDVHPRVAEGGVLGRFAHAVVDTSDGLADGSRLLAEASGVCLVIDRERLPLPPGLRRLAPAAQARAVVYGGDYELLAAMPPESIRRATRAIERAGGRLSAIGRVERGTGSWMESTVSQDRRIRLPMPPGGWRPFESLDG